MEIGTSNGVDGHGEDSAAPILQLMTSFIKSRVLFTACELEIFDLIEGSGGSMTAEAVAEKLQLNRDFTERLMNACVTIGILGKENGLFSNTTTSKRWLLKNVDDGIGSLWNTAIYFDKLKYSAFKQLTNVVKNGFHTGLDNVVNDDIENVFTLGMHGFSMQAAETLAKTFDLSEFRDVVDLGGGSGAFASTLSRIYPNMDVTLFEIPKLETVVKKIVPDESKMKFKWGDFLDGSPLPPADLYVLGNVLQTLSDEKVDLLLQNIVKTLKKDGAVLILEKMFTDSSKTGSLHGCWLDMVMMLVRDGRIRCVDEIMVQLNRYGFSNAKVHFTGDSCIYDAILARKC